MRKSGGFTLVELLIVIAILSILASIALPVYLSYRQKAKVASQALPYAEECTREIIEYCMNLKPSSSTNINISDLSLSGCTAQTLSLFNTSLNITGNFQCEPDGVVSSGSIDAKIVSIDDFTARCIVTDSGIKCAVVNE
ncbi:type IV pilin protein [Persephonella sp.]